MAAVGTAGDMAVGADAIGCALAAGAACTGASGIRTIAASINAIRDLKVMVLGSRSWRIAITSAV